jgi:hypothetical protein
MQNKDIYKMYEDKVDKLVHDTFVQDMAVVTNGTEWNSLQQRLIQHQTQQKKAQKKPLLLLLTIVLLSTSTVIGYNYFTQKNTKNNIAINNSNNTVNTTNSVTEKGLLSTNNNDETTIIDEPVNENNITKNSENYVQPPTSIENLKNTLTKSNNIKTKAPFTKKTITNQFQNIATINKKSKINSNKVKIQNSYTNFNNDNQLELNNDVKNVTDNTTNKEIENVYDNDKVIGMDDNKNNDVVAVAPTHTPSLITVKNDTQKAPVVAKLKKNKRTKEMPEHEFNAEKKWYVEAFSGVNNSRKDKNSFAAFLAPAGYINKRLNQEYNLNTIQAGVVLKVQKKHFIFGSGVNYLQLGDKVNYRNDTASFIFNNANGNTNFTYLELPFTAGYEWANKRWGFTLQGGLAAGILMNLSGQYASINNYNTQLFDVKNNKSTFKKAIFNVVINPQINYYISQNINIFASPMYRRNLQPITANDADLKQKYSSFGFNIGIRTKLKY